MIEDLETLIAEKSEYENLKIDSVRSFEDACLLTNNKGIVISLLDGTEFQLTIVQSR